GLLDGEALPRRPAREVEPRGVRRRDDRVREERGSAIVPLLAGADFLLVLAATRGGAEALLRARVDRRRRGAVIPARARRVGCRLERLRRPVFARSDTEGQEGQEQTDSHATSPM